MNVYAVVSETMHEISYDRMEEEWGALALIVVARNRGQARYLAAKSDRALRGYSPPDWPRLWVKKIRMPGVITLNPGVLPDEKAEGFWELVRDWNPSCKGAA